MSQLHNADFYKTGHAHQYPDGTEFVNSNWTPRKSRDPEVKEVVFFGLQYAIKKYLKGWDSFFSRPLSESLSKYKRRINNAGMDVKTDHIEKVYSLGYLPLEIRALPEGTLCPIGVPMFTIQNTHEDGYWLTNYLETIISTSVWLPCTSATTARLYKQVFLRAAMETDPEGVDFINWQGHDFSMRGMAGLEAACMSGAGHLTSFYGTDTIPAIDFLEEYYGADSDKEIVGGSVMATEHSVMSAGGNHNEIGTFDRLITKVYPKGIVSIVSDTWNLWRVLTDYVPSLKGKILNRDGKLVIRPDSGDPVKIICGDPNGKTQEERAGVIELLWNVFGGVNSSAGYRKLDSHIGAIYGDSITLDRAKRICEGLKAKGFASTNVVLGIGSFTYQYTTRDQYGFAMKATWAQINAVPTPIFKDPVTDDGTKKSLKGLVVVNSDMTVSDMQPTNDGGLLQPVYKNGNLLVNHTLAEIRKRCSLT